MPVRSRLVYLCMLPLMGLAACQPAATVETPPAAGTLTPSSRSEAAQGTPDAASGAPVPTTAVPAVGELDRAALRIDFESPGDRTLLSLVDVTNGAPIAGHEGLEFGSLGA